MFQESWGAGLLVGLGLVGVEPKQGSHTGWGRGPVVQPWGDGQYWSLKMLESYSWPTWLPGSSGSTDPGLRALFTL